MLQEPHQNEHHDWTGWRPALAIEESVGGIPFNDLLQIERCDEPGRLLRLVPRSDLENHLGTIHAGALMTLAEAASAEFLVRHFGTERQIIPLLRRFEAKFSRPADGIVTAAASVDAEALDRAEHDLNSKGWGLVTVEVELYNDREAKVLSAHVCWYAKSVDR